MQNVGIKQSGQGIASGMAASQAVDGWMESALASQAGGASAPVSNVSNVSNVSKLTASERFEIEAMPHMNDLFRTATRVLSDRGRAQDVVQEVYLQAWKCFDRFETGTNCRAWLYKILFHCVNHHRRKWFRFPLLKDSEEFVEANLPYNPPIPEHLTDEDVLAALDRIPGDFRAVVLLVDVEEFPYKETADILAVPIGTVMSRLSRGRKLLRAQLAEVAQSYGIGKAAKEGQ